MAGLEGLVRQRSSLKRRLTGIETYINLRAYLDKSIEIVNKKEIELDKILEDFEIVQIKIEEFVTEQNESGILNKAKELEEQYWKVKNSILECREEFEKESSQMEENQSVRSNESNKSKGSEKSNESKDSKKSNESKDSKKSNKSKDSKKSNESTESEMKRRKSSEEKSSYKVLLEVFQNMQSNQMRVGVKVPELILPTFSGKIEEWTTFHDTFESIIDKEAKYEKIDKYHYLVSCLSHDIKQDILARFKLSNDGYDLALKYLKDKYSNKRPIMNRHFSELLSAKSIEKENSKQLRELVDCYCSNIDQIKRSNPEAELFDLLIVFMISIRLDDSTRKAWEMRVKDESYPTWQHMRSFLEERVKILERMSYDKIYTSSNANQNTSKLNHPQKSKLHTTNMAKPTTVMSNQIVAISCAVCKKDHKTHSCAELLKLTVYERLRKIKELKLCFNCLKNHYRAECNNKFSCRECYKMGKPNERHHTILHFDKPRSAQSKQNQETKGNLNKNEENEKNDSKNQERTSSNNNPENKPKEIQAHHSNVVLDQKHVFLLTAIIEIENSDGEFIPCRALLDSGSESCFITENLAQCLRLQRTNASVLIYGLGDKPVEAKHEVNTIIKSRTKNYNQKVNFIVVPKISNPIPRGDINLKNVKILNKFELADPTYYKPSCVDILIGNEYFLDLIEEEKVALNERGLFLKSSVFGWLIAGKIEQQKSNLSCYSVQSYVSCKEDLNLAVRKFWELEEVREKRSLSEEEQYCERLFNETTERNNEGRFVVKLPTRSNFNQLQDNKKTATKCFESLEKRLIKNDEHYNMYREFMSEYESLGHMLKILNENSNEKGFYMPHHSVIKNSSTTTKLRVVFNASSKASNNLSLNDTLCVGPVVQKDLVDIWLNFRMYKYAMSADAKMMYRQILIHPSQGNLQRIMWRENSEQPLQEFALQTVTYGTSPASFLATRCLKQLADENQHKCYDASKAIENSMYMDDLLTGCQTISGAIQLRNDINQILGSSKFHLRKWASNSPEILDNIPNDDIEKLSQSNESIKALGLNWNPVQDALTLNVKDYPIQKISTKRSVLADIAGLFDPLGLEGPVIVTAKMFIQKLWQMGLDWDDPIPNELHQQWQKYRNELVILKTIAIERFIAVDDFVELQMHGFCDASQSAYGACIYIVSKSSNNQIKSSLLCAKSKVAPLSKRTIPELELCSADLLAKLLSKVRGNLVSSVYSVILWSDSSIVLAWLKCPSSKFKVFIANRVASIQRKTSDCEWRHVKTDKNPADYLTRGLLPQQMVNNKLWWHGPEFLISEFNYSANISCSSLDQNVREISSNKYEVACQNVIKEVPSCYQLVAKFSSTRKMARILSYICRFIYNSRSKSISGRLTGPLSNNELSLAFNSIIKSVQAEKFKTEFENLANDVKAIRSKKLKSLKSSIQSLNPFIDRHGVLRVGGRISKSSASFSQKHPIILPSDHVFTEVIIRDVHLENFHAGQRSMLSFIRQKYWPLRAKILIKRIISKCVRCVKANPKPIQQYMGDLPINRVQLKFAFYNTGVDYCGPFYIKSGLVRSKTVVKAYVAVFVCLAVKAIHLELVSDMSTNAFLAALDRFYADHGLSANMYSDNGCNFVGAANEISKLSRKINSSNGLDFATGNSDMGEVFDLFNSTEFQQKISDHESNNNIKWHFIPPHAPEFGGLWEAAVKSVKFHLVRGLANALLTFEEFHTVLKRITAVLNSRPLIAENNDIDDYKVLTPAHFLIGRPMNVRPADDVTDIATNRLDRWRRLQKLSQQFLKSWYNDYLHLLQQRTKRFKERVSVQIGDLVLMVEDNVRAIKWPMARVIEIHPGADNIVRVVTLRNQQGVFKRPVSKICLIPVENQAFQGQDYVHNATD